jgi:hypothetical protein
MTDFNFFALDIELWRIGGSAMAPKFDVVSQPNDWSKSDKEQAAAAHARTFTESQQCHLELWTQFRQYLEENGSPLRTNRPSKDRWTSLSVGRTDFSLALFNNKEGRSGANLSPTGPDAKAHFRPIEARHKAQVETRLAPLGEVEWRLMPHAKESQIMVHRRVSPVDWATCLTLDAWMASAVTTMNELFRPIVKSLDASAYQSQPSTDLGPAADLVLAD